MTQSLPYDSTRDDIFWRSAVANIETGSELFSNLTPKFPISPSHKISSAGSCFAQHIGNWLTQNKYHYIRSKLNTSEMSSFSFGNIYTPRSLLQWFVKSKKELNEYSIYSEPDSGRFFNLLLPNSTKYGYANLAELTEYRELVLSEMQAQLVASDCFIFTLGLIEAWTDLNGICYPSCPGLKAGNYDPALYKLKVFNYTEVFNDLTELFQQIKAINPQINFVLTVSPVPLTATATNNHILIANAYSKSVLRAVAGAFRESRNDVNYFPSFELITTTLSGDFRFLDNRRTVSADGVSFVMRHWAKSLIGEQVTQKDATNLESTCDDEMLDAVKKISERKNTDITPTLLTLIGDSHFGKLAKAFKKLGKPYSGGMVMNGSGFAQQKFMLTNDSDIMIPMESADSRRLWQPIVANLDSICKAQRQTESCVVTNIGLQTHQTVSMFIAWMKSERADRLAKIGIQDYVDFFNEKMHAQMTIVFRLKQQGHRVLIVSDTPFWQHFEESKNMAPLVMAYMDAFEYVWLQMGVEFFHAARRFNEEISNPLAYASELIYSDGSHDYFHGGDLYYDWLATKLEKIIKG